MGKVTIIRYSIATLLKKLATAAGKEKDIELVEAYCETASRSLGKKLGEITVNGRTTYKSLDQICITM